MIRWRSASSPPTRRWCEIAVPGFGRNDGGAYRAAPSSAGCPMPYKFNEPRRHKIPRARYRVQNWPEYDRALQRRGDLTVWVTPEAIAAWQPPRTGRRGRPRDYSDLAIAAQWLTSCPSPQWPSLTVRNI